MNRIVSHVCMDAAGIIGWFDSRITANFIALLILLGFPTVMEVLSNFRKPFKLAEPSFPQELEDTDRRTYNTYSVRAEA